MYNILVFLLNNKQIKLFRESFEDEKEYDNKFLTNLTNYILLFDKTEQEKINLFANYKDNKNNNWIK